MLLEALCIIHGITLDYNKSLMIFLIKNSQSAKYGLTVNEGES